MNNNESIARQRKGFLKKLHIESVIALVGGGIVSVVVTEGYTQSPALKEWMAILAGTFLTGWLSSIIDLYRSFPEMRAQEYLNRWRDHYPSITMFIEERFALMSENFNEQVKLLTGGSGEKWTDGKRLETANLICEGTRKIRSYSAISADPPYQHPSATRWFYRRLADRLPKKNTRRLLVFPVNELIEGLAQENHRKYIKEFVEIHNDHGFELRYWPYGIRKLEKHLELILANSDAKILVDFGIIDAEDINEPIVFGQEIGNDNELNSGKGHIVLESNKVSRYIEAFDSLWGQAKSECYPASQLSVFALMANMREKVSSAGTSVSNFYDSCIGQIKSSKQLYAIDVVGDKEVWWRKDEYIQFKDATVTAANNGAECSRLYIFHHHFGTIGETQTFIDNVIKPQINSGISIGIVFSSDLVDANVGAVDLIFNSEGWGFYLLPGDDFSKGKLTEKKNKIDSTLEPDLMKLYHDVHFVVKDKGVLVTDNYVEPIEEYLQPHT